ncbi:MAG: glycosyltransferase family 39 protein [Chloroflexi bacterium]|nr:glycosyltransferase family 39 protein [Chloroflexota bacterium]
MYLRRQWWLTVGILILLSTIVGREVYFRLIVPAAPLNFDEAAHSLPGYYMLRDFLNHDLRAFWGDFHIQTLWPPMFSILQAPFLGLLGRTDETARLFAYLMLVATMLMACLLAREIFPQRAPLAAWVAGLLALSAPGWLYVSSWAMQETPVAFMVFVTFWAYLRARRRGRVLNYAVTGALLFALFLTKYNYAAFALAAIGLIDLLGRLRAKQLRPMTFIALYLPFVLGLAMWFFTGTDIASMEVKWRDFAFFVSNENSGYEFWSGQNLLYYVRASADWLMPHAVVLAATLVAAVIAIRKTRHAGVAVLAVFFALGFVLATLHQLKSPRYITPIFPSLWLLAGLGAAAWASTKVRAKFVAAVVLSMAIASWAFWLPRLQPVWAGNLADDMRAATDQIVRWQDGAKPVLIIGTFGEMSPPLFEWRLRPLPSLANNPAVQYDAPPTDGADDIARVQKWLGENPGAQVTLIALSKDSPLYNTDDMKNKNAWRQEIVAHFGEVRGMRKVDERVFADSGLVVSYWISE